MRADGQTLKYQSILEFSAIKYTTFSMQTLQNINPWRRLGILTNWAYFPKNIYTNYHQSQCSEYMEESTTIYIESYVLINAVWSFGIAAALLNT